MKITQLLPSIRLTLLFLSMALTSCGPRDIELQTASFVISVNEKGTITALKDKVKSVDYLAKGVPAPLLSIVWNDSTTVSPKKMIVDEKENTLKLLYDGDAVIHVSYKEAESHVSFEITGAEPLDQISGVIWGAYPTTIDKTVGEVVGVVRDDDFAIGLQALNIKTTGGWPVTNAGFVPNQKGPAAKTEYGSALQAFSINRDRERKVNVWEGHYKEMPISPIEGETVLGSKIALFGCPVERALTTIGNIEVAEGLPHPVMEGEWVKTHPNRSKAYFITSFGEDNFEELLPYVKEAGMNAIYHSHPFKNWGKFDLIPELFPNGNSGMKQLVDRAKSEGIRVGVHTLTTFITPNDPFIAPIPNANLAKTGFGKLTANLDANTTEIPIDRKEFFDDEKYNWMHTVQIGDELIRYRTISSTPPFKLLDCERGAFNTVASEHKKGEVVGKLLDHPYKVFFPNMALQTKMAQNLTDFFNETGISQMDFDGHEGALATGQGTYAMDDYAHRVFKGTKHLLVNGSSRTTHYYWHINHYINWGEPWYGGFRESQVDHRFNIQEFLEANYLPNMLGWFSLTPETSVADIEWMLAKGAGYNAGFALSANLKSLKENPDTYEILNKIRNWEQARLSGAFSDKQRCDLKNPSMEFRLEEGAEDTWRLTPFQNHDFVFAKPEVQPGQPTYAEWKFHNGMHEQPINVHISLEGEGTVSDISLEVGNYATIVIAERIKKGEIVSIAPDGKWIHYNNKGAVLKEGMIPNPPLVKQGANNIHVDCKIEKDAPKIKLKLSLVGNGEKVKSTSGL